MPTTSRAAPRWKVVFDQLKHEVKARPFGSDFYSIAEVCRTFDVSQITAIRALNELAGQGLIEKIWGKGHIVRHLDRKAFIRLITPAGSGRNLTLDPALRRRLEGISSAAKTIGVDFDTLSEQHLSTLFPRDDAMYGFLLPPIHSHAVKRFLRTHRLPAVLVDPIQGYARHAHARTNRIHAGYIATRHLIELGHRRIGCITGPVCRRNFRDRLRGYRAALSEAGLPFRWSLIRENEHDNLDAAGALLKELLSLRRPPTAVIAGDDTRALHILNACRQLNVHVPGQLSVVGYPNYPESHMSDPPLTVVDAQFEQVGEAAVKLLLEQMFAQRDGEKVKPLSSRQTVIEPTLVIRASTGPAPDKSESRSKERENAS